MEFFVNDRKKRFDKCHSEGGKRSRRCRLKKGFLQQPGETDAEKRSAWSSGKAKGERRGRGGQFAKRGKNPLT